MSNMKEKERLTEIDSLRGLAALAVLCFHFTLNYWRVNNLPYPPLVIENGRYGVQLFFMISGFVIFMTLEKTRLPMDFIVSRFSRLYPTYWASIIINVAWCAIVFHPIPAKQVIANSTMFQGWFHQYNIDGSYWTLGVELSFYIVMFTLFLSKKLRYIESFGLAWIALEIINVRIGTFFHYKPPFIINQSLLLIYGHLFLAGIILYNIRAYGDTWTRRICLVLCVIAEFLVTKTYYPSPEYIMLFIGIFYLIFAGKANILRHQSIVWLGTISYSLYLIHQNVGGFVINRMIKVTHNYFLLFIIPMIVSIAVAALINMIVEKPSMQVIRNLYKRIKISPATSNLRKTLVQDVQ